MDTDPRGRKYRKIGKNKLTGAPSHADFWNFKGGIAPLNTKIRINPDNTVFLPKLLLGFFMLIF
jgi:hypothetical protein